MREFQSFGAFAEHLASLAAMAPAAERAGAEVAARIVEHEAKAEIGTYQTSAGPFQTWPELSDVTKRERVELGFTENDPLLRTGALRDSIGHSVEAFPGGAVAVVGSTSDVAVDQELGTSRIPERSFLGRAAFIKRDAAVEAFLLTVGGFVAGIAPRNAPPSIEDIPF